MSTQSTRMFTCPKCSKEYEVSTWDSINVQLDPDLLETLYHNEIFKFECPHCHEVYQIAYPCLYHNPEQKFIVWLVDEKISEDLKKNPLVPYEAKGNYTYRYCKKIMEFVEKIRILEDGLDDRIIEMAKMFCEKQLIDSQQAKAEEIAYTVYNLYKDDEVEVVLMINDELVRMKLNYKEFEKVFLQQEAGYEIRNNEFARVNRDWMIDRAEAAVKKMN